MNPDEAVRDLLWRFSSDERGAGTLTALDLKRWPVSVAAGVLRLRLLVEHTPAASVQCPACENEHHEAVEFSEDARHLFVRCPNYGRVEIEPDDCKRWRLDVARLAGLLRDQLELAGTLRERERDRLWSLGLFGSDSPREVLLVRGLPWADGARLRGLIDFEKQLVIAIDGEGTREPDVACLADLWAWDGVGLSVDRELLRRADREILPPRPAMVVVRYELRREGRGWCAAFEGQQIKNLPDLKGLHDIHMLLARASQPVPVTDLLPTSLVQGGIPLIPSDDLRALKAVVGKHAVRDRDVRTYLRQVSQRGRTPRLSATSLNQAANAVRNRIDRAIDRIGEDSAPMAQHLDRWITKGLVCSYRPPEPVIWEL